MVTVIINLHSISKFSFNCFFYSLLFILFPLIFEYNYEIFVGWAREIYHQFVVQFLYWMKNKIQNITKESQVGNTLWGASYIMSLTSIIEKHSLIYVRGLLAKSCQKFMVLFKFAMSKFINIFALTCINSILLYNVYDLMIFCIGICSVIKSPRGSRQILWIWYFLSWGLNMMLCNAHSM